MVVDCSYVVSALCNAIFDLVRLFARSLRSEQKWNIILGGYPSDLG